MKHIICLTALILLIGSAFSTVWHVNNDLSYNSDFAQIADAVSASEVIDGDTLYVYGSVTVYANVNLAKQLTIIGPGFFLSENSGLQNSNLSASIANFTFQSGSSGSVMAGMLINSYMNINASNVSIIGCYTLNVRLTAGNCYFQGCYFSYKSGYNSTTVDFSNAPNTIVTNCFFGGNWGFNALHVATTSTAIISNCVIRGEVTIRNSEMFNCIMYKDGNYSLNFNIINSSVHHNVFMYYSGFDWSTVITDPTNELNVTEQVFVSEGTSDGKYLLYDNLSNPALTAGIFDDECGMFGGATPYKLSGIPNIPTIFEFTLHSSGNTLPVRVGARSGN